MKNNLTVIPVVAAALIRADGQVLMQKRAAAGAHGGLWEFPGGKVDYGESPEAALARELAEELGIVVSEAALSPVGWAGQAMHEAGPRGRIVILLYMCREWRGEPQCLVGDGLGWFAPDAIPGLAMPPLDYPLADALIVKIAACQPRFAPL